DYHVVAEIIKAELIIGTIGNIGAVGFAALFSIWIVQVYTIYFQAVKVEDGLIPFGITLSQIVVNCNYMHATTGKCVEIGRKDGGEGFTFTPFHFGNCTLMHADTPNK